MSTRPLYLPWQLRGSTAQAEPKYRPLQQAESRSKALPKTSPFLAQKQWWGFVGRQPRPQKYLMSRSRRPALWGRCRPRAPPQRLLGNAAGAGRQAPRTVQRHRSSFPSSFPEAETTTDTHMFVPFCSTPAWIMLTSAWGERNGERNPQWASCRLLVEGARRRSFTFS